MFIYNLPVLNVALKVCSVFQLCVGDNSVFVRILEGCWKAVCTRLEYDVQFHLLHVGKS